ncbi:MAG TPA: hypothetical protein VFN75_07075, partial [Pseudonocardiaceae bacterium]|nr:hypothetical protein [Pseudonocardiaceae bacterium]
TTDVEETLGALSDLVHQGKVRSGHAAPRPGDPGLQPAVRRVADRPLAQGRPGTPPQRRVRAPGST